MTDENMLRPWDEDYEPPESFTEEEEEFQKLSKTVTPNEFVFAVKEDPDHWSFHDGCTIFVAMSPKSYWDREGYQWDQHLTGYIPEEDLKKLKLEEAYEATFDYLGETKETCIQELAAYGLIHDPKFQEWIESID